MVDVVLRPNLEENQCHESFFSDTIKSYRRRRQSSMRILAIWNGFRAARGNRPTFGCFEPYGAETVQPA